MIQKMKKLTFLVYHREYDDFLHRLQELGVMHIEAGALSGEQSEAVTEDVPTPSTLPPSKTLSPQKLPFPAARRN